MECPPELTPSTPSRAWRRLLSLLLLIHFFAILTTVTAFSTPDCPAPRMAVWADVPLRPYLQVTFLNSAYRFFAPNPGVPTILWFRVSYSDQNVCWVEAPVPADSWLRAGYQRRLNLAMHPGQHLFPVADSPGHALLTPIGEISLGLVRAARRQSVWPHQ